MYLENEWTRTKPKGTSLGSGNARPVQHLLPQFQAHCLQRRPLRPCLALPAAPAQCLHLPPVTGGSCPTSHSLTSEPHPQGERGHIRCMMHALLHAPSSTFPTHTANTVHTPCCTPQHTDCKRMPHVLLLLTLSHGVDCCRIWI